MARRTNGIAKAGFALSIIGAALCWVPWAGIILLGLGFIFSVIGLIMGLASNRGGIGYSVIGILISSIVSVLLYTVIMKFLENSQFINL